MGEAFEIDGVTYTPVDTLNYDAVGRAALLEGEGARVSGAHKTLPLPSYVEVTSLETGRTALVRLETRGPMRNDALIALSPAASEQFGFAIGSMPAVRVRRVNPPEVERARLRAGDPAPLRMDTPASLLTVLKRKLAQQEPQPSKPPATPAISSIDPDMAAVRTSIEETALPASHKPEVDEKPVQNAATGSLYVQVGAFSSKQRADTAAPPLGATVSKPGKFWLVRMGPYNSAADAGDALEKARAAGYSDAMVKRTD